MLYPTLYNIYVLNTQLCIKKHQKWFDCNVTVFLLVYENPMRNNSEILFAISAHTLQSLRKAPSSEMYIKTLHVTSNFKVNLQLIIAFVVMGKRVL